MGLRLLNADKNKDNFSRWLVENNRVGDNTSKKYSGDLKRLHITIGITVPLIAIEDAVILEQERSVLKKKYPNHNNEESSAISQYLDYLKNCTVPQGDAIESSFDQFVNYDKDKEIYYFQKSNIFPLNTNPASNILYYGVPGSGKSYTVDKECKGKPMQRVVFHPDYTNSDFIGQIIPGLNDEGKLEYKFAPGPFTNILLAALKNPQEHHYLVIEEINRGNAPAIFGEVFQLLDRNNNGESRYGIVNGEVLKYLNAELTNKITEIKIPGNLSVLATMNTSDQNVFTLDTAFQRRWNMKYIKNNFDENKDAVLPIAGSSITWKAFGEVVNDILADTFTGIGSAEDKGLGAFFAMKDEIQNAEKFGEKVLKYLWDDAFKMDREAFFYFRDGFKRLQHFLELFEKETVVDGKTVDSLSVIVKPDVFEKMKAKVPAKGEGESLS